MTNYTMGSGLSVEVNVTLSIPEPHRLYERHCDGCDMARERELAAGCCGSCANYTDAPEQYDSKVRHGWCSEYGCFTEYDHPARDCEDDYEPCR